MNKPLPLAEAIEVARKRRLKFEQINQLYIDNTVSKIFEPMIIHLMNMQPQDIISAMKIWLLI